MVGANGNTVNLGPDGSCPANLNGFSDPTTTASIRTPGLLTCMSWVLRKARVDAALAASSTPGAVVITSHFAVSCYSGCGTVSGTATATQVLRGADVADVRCDLPCRPSRAFCIGRCPATLSHRWTFRRRSLSSPSLHLPA